MIQQLQLCGAARQAGCFVPTAAAPRPARRAAAVVRCSSQDEPEGVQGRRQLLLGGAALAATAARGAGPAAALPGFKKDLDAAKKRKIKIPDSEYRDGPDGLRIYDVVEGDGAEAGQGRRVVVHLDVKLGSYTVFTTRQGMGVTGGTPFGFDVGARPGAGGAGIKGVDLGVRGMRVGGRRKLRVPPNLAYGDRGSGEIPPGATLDIDMELLSIKQDPRGFQVKLVEG